MSFLLRFSARTLVLVWTLICVLVYLFAEVLGEVLIAQTGVVLGGTLEGLLGFLHDIGMVLLVLVWLAVAWVIWNLGNLAARRG